MAANDNVTEVGSSTHRLPTVSATEALLAAQNEPSNPISLGLGGLDALLYRNGEIGENFGNRKGGLRPGHVVELSGPPGAGKTTLCIQAAVSTLIFGKKVVWIDAHATLAMPRVLQILQAQTGPETEPATTQKELLQHVTHYTTSTIPHLLALTQHGVKFPPADTDLIVIDSLSTLLENEFSRNLDTEGRTDRQEGRNWLATRRKAIIAELASRFSRLAAYRNLAIVITSNVITKITADSGALLCPAMTGQEWENALSARILLYCDWRSFAVNGDDSKSSSGVVRFAEIIGPRHHAGIDKAVAFVINQNGTQEVSVIGNIPGAHDLHSLVPATSRKRPLDEVVNSDHDSESDYEWLDDIVETVAGEGLVS